MRKAESTGFQMRQFVSDMGLKNQKFLADLGINPGNTCLKNPYCEEKHIQAFCDVLHLLKLLRNHLIDKWYQLPDGKKIERDIFQKLIKKQKGYDLEFAYKINNDYLLLFNTETQNVRKTAELLSASIASAIDYFRPGNDHKFDFIRTEETAWFMFVYSSYWEKLFSTISERLFNFN